MITKKYQMEKNIVSFLMNKYDHNYSRLTINDFDDPTFRQIFKFIKDSYDQNKDFDIYLCETVTNIPEEELNSISDEMVALSRFEEYVYELKKETKKRSLERVLNEVRNDIFAGKDVELILSSLTSNIENLEDEEGEEDEESLDDYIDKYVNSLYKKWERVKNGGTVGISTGIKGLDNICGGLIDGSLYVVGARPSMGKSAFALNMAWNIAKQNIPVSFYSLEMSEDEIINRIIAREMKINSFMFRSMNCEESKIKEVIKKAKEIRSKPLYIGKESNPKYIFNKIRQDIRKKHIKVVFIDYLQLFHTKSDNRNIEIGAIAQSFKNLAWESKIPIVLLSQLSRNVEYRTNKRPMMADLRESGNIEQAANVIWLLYRDSVYEGTDTYIDPFNKQDVLEVLQVKGRDEGINSTYLSYELPTSTIEKELIEEDKIRYINFIKEKKGGYKK